MRCMLMIALATALMGGCKSDSRKQLEAEAALIPTPLEHDPTHRIELARWWSNGNELLRLDPNAAYALYDSQNRYDAPIERGRWSQPSYAVVWLEPYNTITVDPRRVSITRINGRLALVIPDHEPMFGLDRPPAVLEDRLVGEWRGEFGTLFLTSDMRFTLTPTEPDDADPIFVNRQGRWRIAGDHLLLRPDLAGAQPMRWPIEIEDEQITISAPRGELTYRSLLPDTQDN